MADVLIKFVFNIIRIISNIFQPIIQAIADKIGVGGNSINFNNFFNAISSFITTITEGGVFMKKFLMIPNGILSVFFVWVVAKMGIFVIVRTLKFAIRMYNYIKF